jgi:hypothetical protein
MSGKPLPGRVFEHKRRKFGRKADMRAALNKLKSQVAKNTSTLEKTIEGKQVYVENSDTLPSSSFVTIDLLDGLVQGVADTGSGSSVADGARIGNSINVKSLSLKFYLEGFRIGANPANPQVKSAGLHRVIIYDSPCGESLTATHILREATTAIAAMRSHYNVAIEKGKMYNIWYDRTFVISDAKPAIPLEFYKKWKNGKKVLYDDNTSAPSNFKPRMLIISENVPAGGNNSVYYSSKVRYEDM